MKNKKSRYALTMFVPFALIKLTACQEYEHPMVIDGFGSFGANDYFTVLRDIETDSTKFFYWDREPNLFKDFRLGDTADIVCRTGFRNQEEYFKKHNIISWRDANMLVDGPTFAKRNPDNPIMNQITRGRILVR